MAPPWSIRSTTVRVPRASAAAVRQSGLKLPSGTTDGSAGYTVTTTSGYLQDIGKATGPSTDTSVEGFSTTSYNPSGGKFTDGGGSVQAAVSGVFYNYGAATTSTSLSALNFPSSSATDTLQISENFGGPTFVAWTAPQRRIFTSSLPLLTRPTPATVTPAFYILTPNPLNPTGPPTMLFEATNYAGGQQRGDGEQRQSNDHAGGLYQQPHLAARIAITTRISAPRVRAIRPLAWRSPAGANAATM